MCEELYAEFMVVTQRAVFRKGYLGMDPAKIPQIEEGEREKVAKDLLEAEGTRSSRCSFVLVLILSQGLSLEVCHLPRLTVALNVALCTVLLIDRNAFLKWW